MRQIFSQQDFTLSVSVEKDVDKKWLEDEEFDWMLNGIFTLAMNWRMDDGTM